MRRKLLWVVLAMVVVAGAAIGAKTELVGALWIDTNGDGAAATLSETELTDLKDAGDSTLHYHASDRNPANLSAAVPLTKGGLGADVGTAFSGSGVPSKSGSTWSLVTSFAASAMSVVTTAFAGNFANSASYDTAQELFDVLDDCLIPRVVVCTNLASPSAAELGNGRGNKDQVIAYQAAAGSDASTRYEWDPNNTDAENKPYIVSATGGKWVAVGGRYVNSGITSLGQIVGTGLLTAANQTDLTDAGDSTLHYHASDRNPANLSAVVPLTKGGFGADVSTAFGGGNGVPQIVTGTWSLVQSFAASAITLTTTNFNGFLPNSTAADTVQEAIDLLDDHGDKVFLTCGLAASGNLSNSASYPVIGNATMSTSKGLIMTRAGSVTGYGFQYNPTIVSGTPEGRVAILVGSTIVWEKTGITTGGSIASANATQAAGTDAVAAGDKVSLRLYEANAGGTISFADFFGVVEITLY